MLPRTWLALSLGLLPALAQTPGARSAWVLATDGKGALVQDLTAKDWTVKVAGKEVPLTQLETPAQTSARVQTWALVFEPIRDPAYRTSAFQAAAQFLVNVAPGDRVVIAARRKAGLELLTPGVTPDRLAWVRALEQLPGTLSAEFDGTSGARGAGLEDLKAPGAGPDPAAQQEAFVGALRTFLGGLAKAVAASPYAQPDPRGVRPIDRLGLNTQSTVRGRLKGVDAEMASLGAFLGALGRLPGPAHCVVFSRNDADDFSHPAVKIAMHGKFTRSLGDEGGPAEAAEVAYREITLLQDRMREVVRRTGVTLHAVAGSGGAYLGHLGPVAEATGGLALGFEAQMPGRLGASLQAFAYRYRLTWEEGAEAPASAQPLSITTARDGVKLMAPRER